MQRYAKTSSVKSVQNADTTQSDIITSVGSATLESVELAFAEDHHLVVLHREREREREQASREADNAGAAGTGNTIQSGMEHKSLHQTQMMATAGDSQWRATETLYKFNKSTSHHKGHGRSNIPIEKPNRFSQQLIPSEKSSAAGKSTQNGMSILQGTGPPFSLRQRLELTDFDSHPSAFSFQESIVGGAIRGPMYFPLPKELEEIEESWLLGEGELNRKKEETATNRISGLRSSGSASQQRKNSDKIKGLKALAKKAPEDIRQKKNPTNNGVRKTSIKAEHIQNSEQIAEQAGMALGQKRAYEIHCTATPREASMSIASAPSRSSPVLEASRKSLISAKATTLNAKTRHENRGSHHPPVTKKSTATQFPPQFTITRCKEAGSFQPLESLKPRRSQLTKKTNRALVSTLNIDAVETETAISAGNHETPVPGEEPTKKDALVSTEIYWHPSC
ncbi:hypothetical protein HDU67_007756 [Dinochytrium kinnereticum]|nr:hypothetical protein HDU67_007756 [Dinochytrium kinnereticum]